MAFDNIQIKEADIETAVLVNKTILEFDEEYSKQYFEDRYIDKEHIILVAFVNNVEAGYMISYKKDNDGSIYCWMAGVNPNFRRKGLLKQMMDYLQDWSKKKGYAMIKIKTRNNKREMLSFLVKYGFNFINVEEKEDIDESRINLVKKI